MSATLQASPESFSYLSWSRTRRVSPAPRTAGAAQAIEAARREVIVLLMTPTAPRDQEEAIRQSQLMHELFSTMLLCLGAAGAESSEVADQIRRLRAEEAELLRAHGAALAPAQWSAAEVTELRRLKAAILAPGEGRAHADLDEG